MDIKENAKNVDVWIRGLFILVFGVIFYFLYFLIWLVVIFQFVMKLMTTNLNEQLLDFSDALNKYVSQILVYITFLSEERPFPFSPWPGSKASSKASNSTKKKIASKKSPKEKTTETDAEDGGEEK